MPGGASNRAPDPTDRVPQPSAASPPLLSLRGTVTAIAVVLVVVLSTFVFFAQAPQGPPSPPGRTSPPPLAGPIGTPPGSFPTSNATLECDGILWSPELYYDYSPSYCYGHDEPTMSYISSAPGSGANASYTFTLPADSVSWPQGGLYATFWIGGTVFDSISLDRQAFLEFQFYPDPPEFTGAGSGAQDCLGDGSFNPVWTPGSNQWFACVIVWQITSTENAVFAEPLNLSGTTAILVMHSNDRIWVNLTGTAQSATKGWHIALNDSTAGTAGHLDLVSGSRVLPPYYAVAASGNVLLWGASKPGAIAFAYEIGHTLNSSLPFFQCAPGNLQCYSYSPASWIASGQLQLSLPVMGSPGTRTYPGQIAFGSSQGGESEVNATCGTPSWSGAKTCLYPYYIYRGGNYSFTYDAGNVTNSTHTYGNEFQFPGVAGSRHFETAPWGTVSTSIFPAFATVQFNPRGGTHVLSVGPNATVYGQFMEGPYWLNVTAPGCTGLSLPLYLKTGATYSTPVRLQCTGFYAVNFQESGLPAGTNWSVALNGSSRSSSNPTVSFGAKNGVSTFTVGPVPGFYPNVTSGTITVSGANVVRPILWTAHPYAVNFTENGLPLGTNWSVTLNGSTKNSTVPWIAFSVANGSYAFTILTPILGAPGTRYVTGTSSGTIPVGGASVYFPTTFTTQYRLTTGALPNGKGNVTPPSGWYAVGAPVSLSAVSFGAWIFGRWTGAGPGAYSGIANPAQIVLRGPVNETARFALAYSVAFSENGLPSGTTWLISLNGSNRSSTFASLTFPAPNGTYPYTVGVIPGYHASRYSGSVTILAGSVNVPAINWTPVRYTLSFVESGLAVGTNWSVVLELSPPLTGYSSTGTLVFSNLTNGTYAFGLVPVPGYQFSSALHGNVTISGTNLSEPIGFAPKPTPILWFGLPVWEASLLIGVALALVALALVWALLRRKRATPPAAEPAEGAPPGAR